MLTISHAGLVRPTCARSSGCASRRRTRAAACCRPRLPVSPRGTCTRSSRSSTSARAAISRMSCPTSSANSSGPDASCARAAGGAPRPGARCGRPEVTNPAVERVLEAPRMSRRKPFDQRRPRHQTPQSGCADLRENECRSPAARRWPTPADTTRRLSRDRGAPAVPVLASCSFSPRAAGRRASVPARRRAHRGDRI